MRFFGMLFFFEQVTHPNPPTCDSKESAKGQHWPAPGTPRTPPTKTLFRVKLCETSWPRSCFFWTSPWGLSSSYTRNKKKHVTFCKNLRVPRKILSCWVGLQMPPKVDAKEGQRPPTLMDFLDSSVPPLDQYRFVPWGSCRSKMNSASD